MNFEAKTNRRGDKLTIVLPPAAAQRLDVTEGDTLRRTKLDDQASRLTSDKGAHQRTMQILESCMDRYGNALRELATS